MSLHFEVPGRGPLDVDGLHRLPFAAALVSTEGRVLHSNVAIRELAGWQDLGIDPLQLATLLGFEAERESAERVSSALAGQQVFAAEVLCSRQTGEAFWCDLVLMPVTSAGGRPSALCLCRDVTARHAPNQPPEACITHDRLVLDRIQAGIVVTNAATEIIYANAKAVELMGVTHDAVLGATKRAPRWVFTGEDGKRLSPPEYPAARAIASKSVVRDLLIGHTRESDGQLVWGMCNAYPMLDEHGAVAEVVVSITDVTELKQTERALKKSEERLRLVLQGSNDAPWDWDITTDEFYYSPRWWHMVGYTEGELPADRELWSRLVHPDERQAVRDHIRDRMVSGATSYEIESSLQHKAGHTIRVLARGHILRDEHGKPIRISGTNTDVTAQRELEARLRQAQKMEAIGQLAGGVAHDFNNLLAVIVGNLELLRSTVSGSPDDRDALEDTLASARRGTELTRSLLAFSRQQTIRPAPLEVGAVLAELTNVLRRVINEAIEIEATVAPDLPPILVDPSLLHSALLNLAINSRDAMPNGGTLRLSATRRGDDARISVADSGIGMTRETQDRALEPFFTTKPPGQGTGLGLSMVYGFVKQSGGTLTIESSPGRGTSVHLDFPVAPEVAPVTTPARAKQTTSPRTGRVLVVEDDPHVWRLCLRALARLGFQAAEAENGPQALALLTTTTNFDVLLTDVVMPHGMNGRDVALAVQQRVPGIKVIYMSGYLPEHFDEETRSLLQPLLNKPFAVDALAEVLDEVLQPAATSS